jgi:acyl-CoA synthetase (AMP-forming)/AMP-acid ligase II
MSDTLVGLLADLAQGPHAHETRLTALDADGAVADTLSWAGWYSQALALAGHLQALGPEGSRVLVPAMSKLDFHIGFMACLCAGMVAVPVPQPRTASASGARSAAQRSNGRLDGICRDSSPCAVLVSGGPDDRLIGLEHLPHVTVMADNRSDQPAWRMPARALDPNATALLQYTSGSTSEPRGVVISQGNWVVNRRTTCERIQVNADTTVVLWLPLFHDMGLGNSLVMPLVAGASLVTMEPTTFVREPMVWLRALSHKADVFSSAPDFAFHLCVDRTTPEERAGLDLSGCRTVINGSEPVRVETIDRFASAFAPAGFQRAAMRPGYGLAESTLGVTLGAALSPVVAQAYDRETLANGQALRVTPGAAAIELVGCGALLGGIEAMAQATGATRPRGQTAFSSHAAATTPLPGPMCAQVISASSTKASFSSPAA